MWRFLLVLVWAAVAAAEIDRELLKEELTEYRLKNQNLHIDELEREFHHLEKQYHRTHKRVSKHLVNHVKSRLAKAEGTFCPDKHDFQCGGEKPECINDLLVCDDHVDCRNGKDEHSSVCDTHIIQEGSAYYGIATWHSCVARGSHKAAFTIIHAERFPFFKSRVFIRAAVTNEIVEHSRLVGHTYMAKGYYNFGQYRLVLVPDKDDPEFSIGLVCDFHKFDHDSADCKVVEQASLKVCATIAVSRV